MKFVIEALGLTAGGGKTGLMRLLPALADRGPHHNFVVILADLEEFRALEQSNLRLILQKKPSSLLRRHLHLSGRYRESAPGSARTLCFAWATSDRGGRCCPPSSCSITPVTLRVILAWRRIRRFANV